MWWILMACSSSDMKMATESDERADSGFVYDTGMMNDDAAEADMIENPSWKKISVNLTETTVENQSESLWVGEVWEDLYDDHMTWVCQRRMEYGKVERIDSPLEEQEQEQSAIWYRLNQPSTLESSCSEAFSRPDDEIEVGIGVLIEDVSVATEVTHWLDQDVDLETEEVWGAYIQQSSEQIWAFGVAYHPTENTYILRTVYSLPF